VACAQAINGHNIFMLDDIDYKPIRFDCYENTLKMLKTGGTGVPACVAKRSEANHVIPEEERRFLFRREHGLLRWLQG
jgi:hypothetical protein